MIAGSLAQVESIAECSIHSEHSAILLTCMKRVTVLKTIFVIIESGRFTRSQHISTERGFALPKTDPDHHELEARLDVKCGSRGGGGGQGIRTPRKITSYMGFYRE